VTEQAMNGLALILWTVLGILLSPILIPVAIARHNRSEKRKRERACAFTCVNCGKLLGTASLNLADIEWGARMEGIRRAGYCPRIIRWLHAICANCGQGYAYQEKEDSFHVVRTS
jgi:hypothetical protein